MSQPAAASKVNAGTAPRGSMGQYQLAAGERLSMRLWREGSDSWDAETTRPYETVGYVISGRARLTLGDSSVDLGPGDSWVVPAGVSHSYQILEPFTAVEATAPPDRG